MLSNIDLGNLNREEYINLVLMIIYAFKINYNKFTEMEKDFIKNAIDKSIYEWNGEI